MEAIVERALWSVAIILGGLVAYAGVNRVLIWRARNKRLGLENLRQGVPGVLYFTSPGCLPCQTVQRPALKSLTELLGDRIQVIEVDVSQRPDLADYWGVLSVPTTFIVDRHGEPRRINHGTAGREKLLQQLIEIGETGLVPVVKATEAAQASKAYGE